jgi:beta-glucanase (GH16 family)
LIWSDEFENSGLPDTTKWSYDVGTGSNGWGNSELQYYTEESLKNARVENGSLIITAVKEKMAQSNYTSARLVTRQKGDWRYGRFEIAAKLPKGRGVWPALWMLPTDWVYKEWPKSGELDIMENVGFDPYTIHFNVHTEAYNHMKNNNKGDTLHLSDPHTKFNVYAMEWYEDSVVFFADGRRAFTFRNEHTGYSTWPFDQKFHLLLNIAVGGSWGGQQGVDESIFPQEMIIDYVRVYRFTSTGVERYREKPAIHSSGLIHIDNNELSVSCTGKLTIDIFAIDGKMLFNKVIPSHDSNRRIPCLLPKGMYVAAMNINGISYTQYLLKAR